MSTLSKTCISFTDMIALKKIVKSYVYKKQIWLFANQIRNWLVNAAQSLPLLSKYINLPKGYYASSVEYWQLCQTKNLNDVIYTKFLPPSVSQRNSPKSISGETHWKFDARYIHSNPETFVISIANGRVIGNAGTVITHDDRLLCDVSGIESSEHHVFPYFKLPKCEQVSETVAVLATGAGGKYFHWLLDALPRLEILKKTLPKGLDSIDKYIVNRGISAIPESLEILGISSKKLLFCDSNFHIQAASLVIPSLPGSIGDPPAWVCKFLRENFLKNKADINTPSRLYISRAKAEYRRVKNEENVVKCLSNYGFTAVYLEEYSFAMQIDILSNAEVIVAPHGAGLSNLIWCNHGAKVLEIFSPNYVNVCFWAIANQIGLEYFYLIGDGKKPVDYFDPHLIHDDINVPIDELTLVLKAIFK
ncbi:MAG: glycosyltransferase family 61 protein [Nostoc sp. NOS(2021)]|nr:glycosyltransferase family 61 protein [Nostoc sp. NOS(2021)]